MKKANGFYYLAVALVGCGSARLAVDTEDGASIRSQSLVKEGGAVKGSAGNRCDTSQAGREFSEYDTSGDQRADVRKVFVRVGDETLYRLVMICREADLNADGVKDVVRQYDDEGRPLREETDRDFDGKMDVVSYYQRGELLRKEIDSDANGVIDYKIFYEDNKPVRAERDLLGKLKPFYTGRDLHNRRSVQEPMSDKELIYKFKGPVKERIVAVASDAETVSSTLTNIQSGFVAFQL